MSYVHGKFVWFEHHSPDPAAAGAFYSALFGWRIETMAMGPGEPYRMIMNGADGIGGLGRIDGSRPALWMGYLSVADVDAAHAAALAAGARSLMPPTDFPPVGRGAALADPGGAAFSLWKSSQGDRPDSARAAPGDWMWNELLAGDAERELAFYEKAFGFTHDTIPLGEGGHYYLLKAGGAMRAGLMRHPMPGQPPLWIPYVAVADCEATLARARGLGAQVITEPMDVPDVGRFATVLDAQGAALAFMKPFD